MRRLFTRSRYPRLTCGRNVRELVGGAELEGRSLWGVVRSLLNQQEQQRFLLLANLTTDLGRSRAWIRSAALLGEFWRIF